MIAANGWMSLPSCNSEANDVGDKEDRNSGFNSPTPCFDNDTAPAVSENFGPTMLAGKACDMFAIAWPRTLQHIAMQMSLKETT
jgi:hypothetical protein